MVALLRPRERRVLLRRDRDGDRFGSAGTELDPFRRLLAQQSPALQPVRLGRELARRRERGASPPRSRGAVHRRSRSRDHLAARSVRRALRAPVPLSRDGVAPAPRPLAAGARLRDRLSRHERGRRRGARAAAIEQDLGDRRTLCRWSRRGLDAPALHTRVPRNRGCAPRGRSHPLEARGRTWRFDRRDRSVVRPPRRRHPRQLPRRVRRRALVPLDRHGSRSIRPWCRPSRC